MYKGIFNYDYAYVPYTNTYDNMRVPILYVRVQELIAQSVRNDLIFDPNQFRVTLLKIH